MYVFDTFVVKDFKLFEILQYTSAFDYTSLMTLLLVHKTHKKSGTQHTGLALITLLQIKEQDVHPAVLKITLCVMK